MFSTPISSCLNPFHPLCFYHNALSDTPSRHMWFLPLIILLIMASNWNKGYVMKCHHALPHPSLLPSKPTHAHTLAWAPWNHLHQSCSDSHMNHPFPTLLIYKVKKRSQCRFWGSWNGAQRDPTDSAGQERDDAWAKENMVGFLKPCAFFMQQLQNRGENRLAFLL